jgi:phosphopantetheine--protein transferase-like protein
MNDSEKIRSVVARFFNVAETEVGEAFIFPRERLQGSADRSTLHAALKRMAGVDLPAAYTAVTYGQLVNGTAQPPVNGAVSPAQDKSPAPSDAKQSPAPSAISSSTSNGLAIGIDIQEVDNLPAAGDPWSEPFYLENFTGAEIAYCTRQTHPKLSFCGLWSAKEAAIKCGSEFGGLRPNEIEVTHTENGRPALRIVKGGVESSAAHFEVSISHSGRAGAAVCLRVPRAQPDPVPAAASPARSPIIPVASQKDSSASLRRLVWINFLLSALAILLWLFTFLGHK